MALFGRICQCLLKCANAIPVLMSMSAFIFSYWYYIFEFYKTSLIFEDVHIKYAILCVYHGLFFMYIWSFVKLIVTTSTDIPEQFRVSEKTREEIRTVKNSVDKVDEILRPLAVRLAIQTYSIDGRVRYCDICGLVKPDRTHHCRVCKKCIMKMDHHCPWINNCVSYANYKFFVLFLTYGVLYFGFILTTMIFFMTKVKSDHFWLVFTLSRCFPLLLLAASLTTVKLALLAYHIYLMLHNRTTLDAYRAPQFNYGPDRNGFDLGKRNNFYQVFGKDWFLWFFPVFSSLGNGWSFPTRADYAFAESGGFDKLYEPDEKEKLIPK
ncbi:hypothetical protein M8J76_000454 [Diaphorina citri]|nr:hypothetical protein M8J75_000293 [Diaphorina citri]KAI5716067.1 hypothetical protein M8J76_000454 [Diaphorina citri]